MIVEDGSGVKGADSYASVAHFRAHHTGRGIAGVDVGTLTDAVVESLLIRATDYIDHRWGSRFAGRKRFRFLDARSVLTLTGQPLVGNTVTIGEETYTFVATASSMYDVQIKANPFRSLLALSEAIAANPNLLVTTSLFFSDNAPVLHVFTVAEGVATTSVLDAGSFGQAESSGNSYSPQPLEFPRLNLRDRSNNLIFSIPDNLKRATAEYALRANTVALAPDPTTHPTGMAYAMVKERVGPIEEEARFDGNTPIQALKPYPAADRLLQEYLIDTGVIRA